MISSFKNRLFIVSGFVSLVVGGIGLFVPLLPTTPLILLAAYLFAKSSPKYHRWIRENRFFGKTVRAWEAGLGFTRREKLRMVVFATLFIGTSFIVCTNIVGRIVLAAVWPIPISVAIFTRTREEDSEV